MKKKALVAGATGLVGQELVKELLDSRVYDVIKVISRRKTPFSGIQGVEEHIIDFEKLEKYGTLVADVDDVFVCLGTTMKKAKSRKKFVKVDYVYPLKLANLAKEIGVKQFLIVTAIGSDRDATFFYSRVKGKLEEELVTLDFPSLHIFRPSLLVGKRRDFRIGEKTAEWVGKPFSFLLIGPYEKYKPIKGKYVAMSMCAIAQEKSSGVHIYESDKIRQLGKVLLQDN
ncbi:NAD(P)H-binding protein [Bacillus tamaricis]|uniref:NAD(P)H-binding protein n=1 Tax=Evansella tamaricis TaxID=2069301 RepID=A0ABS6JBI5_9BACI|nr:NAD(P)H-binding protein [Evansella tamaricis]MBU9710868.1 NAD(P)H-binding protein [Evansella tamaricis]